MGIKGFYQWLKRRYPLCTNRFSCISRPSINNFYIDFTSIIFDARHTCVKKFEIEEVLRMLDTLIQFVRPSNLIFISIDGTSPMAKAMKNRDGTLGGKIVAGSQYMHDIHEALDEFVKNKTKTDSAWKTPRVIYSSVYSPGEAEHKILNFIRERAKISKETKREIHCIYSGDNDLIPLCLLLQDPNFCIMKPRLSEFEVDNQFINGNISKYRLTEFDFDLFYVNFLKDYLRYDIFKDTSRRRLIDWVALTFFVGNDFINFGFSMQHFELALNTYVKFISNKNKYIINENQQLNIPVFIEFLEKFIEQAKTNHISIIIKNTDPKPTEEAELEKICHKTLDCMNWILLYYLGECPSWSWQHDTKIIPSLPEIVKYSKTYSGIIFQKDRPLSTFEHLLCTYNPNRRDDKIPEEVKNIAKTTLSKYYPIDGTSNYEFFLPYDVLTKTYQDIESHISNDKLTRDKLSYDLYQYENGTKVKIILKSLINPEFDLSKSNQNPLYFPSLNSIKFHYQSKISRSGKVCFSFPNFDDFEKQNSIEILNQSLKGKIVLANYPFLKPFLIEEIITTPKTNPNLEKIGIYILSKKDNIYSMKGKYFHYSASDHSFIQLERTDSLIPYCLTAPIEYFKNIVNNFIFHEITFSPSQAPGSQAIITKGEYTGRLCKIISVDDKTRIAKVYLYDYYEPESIISSANDASNWIPIASFITDILKGCTSLPEYINPDLMEKQYLCDYEFDFPATSGRKLKQVSYTLFTKKKGYILEGLVKLNKNAVLIANYKPLKEDIKKYIHELIKMKNTSPADFDKSDIAKFLKDQFNSCLLINRFSLCKPNHITISQNMIESLEKELKAQFKKNKIELNQKNAFNFSFDDLLIKGNILKDEQTFVIGSRVVSISSCGSVPFGTYGTLVGFDTEKEVMFVVTDEELKYGCSLRGRLETRRGFVARKYDFLKVAE
ncbi:hypothetical protein TRFO_06295 [Tritrichomonas foetus]|uniref:XRN 5'-3' exonuclease N-terminus family protein n=1 Tax=Tritrichomonas foetus TaxID=1144522 RepID=A0A1J4K3Z4_9EUKA|nr:hypothetical protein TRFO_06295 [Tritrichomonas foetus]|eukprot:OHT04414.1 hypothetical protein TRFO_06295 [Tritrichomonas foetus]